MCGFKRLVSFESRNLISSKCSISCHGNYLREDWKDREGEKCRNLLIKFHK